jgi:hypothetical protein
MVSLMMIVPALLAGCVPLDPVSQREMESRVFEADPELLYAALCSVLAQKGYDLVQADPAAGIVETGILQGKFTRSQVRAQIKPLGRGRSQLLVGVRQEERGAFSATYKPEPVKVVDYQDLFEEIDTQIYRERILKIERKSKERKLQ